MIVVHGIGLLRNVVDTRVVRLGVHALVAVTVYDAAAEADDGSQTDGDEERSTDHDRFPHRSYRPQRKAT